jgi:hypothetical protein
MTRYDRTGTTYSLTRRPRSRSLPYLAAVSSPLRLGLADGLQPFAVPPMTPHHVAVAVLANTVVDAAIFRAWRGRGAATPLLAAVRR